MRRSIAATLAAGATVAAVLLAATSPAQARSGTHTMSPRGAAVLPAVSANQLRSRGGPIVTSPNVYIVYWGSQWGTSSITNDPSGEAALQLSFFQHIFGSGDTWSTSTTQYCQGVASGTTQCGTSGTHVGHPSASPVRATWLDSGVTAPNAPSTSQIRAEAVRAASHFGVTGINVQIIVDVPHGVRPVGFGTQYCAWHSATTVSGQTLPFTNMPYVTDVGASCGANFVRTSGGVVGASEGVTIVGGHEYAETLTDPNASSGWLSSGGAENGDLCAWISSGQGASAIVSINGASYAVQSLWSNNFNSNNGGCVISYVNSGTQH
jgi:hypothetical protein